MNYRVGDHQPRRKQRPPPTPPSARNKQKRNTQHEHYTAEKLHQQFKREKDPQAPETRMTRTLKNLPTQNKKPKTHIQNHQEINK